MTIAEVQKQGLKELNNVEEASLKTRLLLAYVLGKPKEYLIIHADEEITQNKIDKFFEGIDKLKNGTPLAYITHKQEFMKLDFYVDENVLIPRPDTEILVEAIIERCNENKKIHILDLCTGSGAIAISLASYIPNSSVLGIDISKSALDIAKKNAQKNGVNVSFIESDLLENIDNKEWDVIVSNPPYIETDVIKSLQEEVKKEPIIALDGGKDGLDFYRRIISNAPSYLKNNGLLALEIGYNQANEVTELLNNMGCYDELEVIKDLGGNDRVVLAKRR